MSGTTAPSDQIHALRIDTVLIDDHPATLVYVNDVDLLRLQRPLAARNGARYPNGPKTFLPVDPVDLLPPDSSALLPAGVPRPALIGVCGCREAGCNSLWMQVRRTGDTVIWEPDPTSEYATIDTTWRFELRQYLDAVDEGQRSTERWENRVDRLARELRRRRDSLFGLSMGSTMRGTAADIVHADAWRRDGTVIVFTRPAGLNRLVVELRADRSDDEIIAELQQRGTRPIKGRHG